MDKAGSYDITVLKVLRKLQMKLERMQRLEHIIWADICYNKIIMEKKIKKKNQSNQCNRVARL